MQKIQKKKKSIELAIVVVISFLFMEKGSLKKKSNSEPDELGHSSPNGNCYLLPLESRCQNGSP